MKDAETVATPFHTTSAQENSAAMNDTPSSPAQDSITGAGKNESPKPAADSSDTPSQPQGDATVAPKTTA